MNFTEFIEHIGLLALLKNKELKPTNSIFEKVNKLKVPVYDLASLKLMYRYAVPKQGDDGGCSVEDLLEENPYDLSFVLGCSDAVTARLYRLNNLVQELNKIVEADWIGIYFRVKNLAGEEVLLKHAYLGAYSRAEFPLTPEFAANSNNSTVGLTGKIALVQDIATYDGPYYKCDSKVKSEFCCPIFDKNKKVVGIIDAESFTPNYFTEARLLEIAKVCFDLSLNAV